MAKNIITDSLRESIKQAENRGKSLKIEQNTLIREKNAGNQNPTIPVRLKQILQELAALKKLLGEQKKLLKESKKFEA